MPPVTQRAKLCAYHRRAAVPALVAVAILALARPVAAQGDDAPFRHGPIAFNPAVRLTNLGFDSNVFNDPVDPKADMTAVLQPSAEAALRLGRARLGWNGRADFVFFKRYADQNTAGTTNTTRLDVALNRLRLFATGGYVNARERPGLEIDLRVRRVEQSFGGGVDVRLTPLTNVTVTADHGRVSFDAAAVNGLRLDTRLNRRSERFGASVSHALTPLTSVSVSASTARDRFDAGGAGATESRQMTAGLSFKPLALLTGGFAVGVLQFDGGTSGTRRLQAPTATASLGYTFHGLTQIGLHVTRGVNYSIEDAAAYYLQTGVGVSLSHYLSEQMNVSVSANRESLGYQPSSALALAGGGPTPTSVIATYDAALGYRFTRGVQWSVHVGYMARDAARALAISHDYQDVRVFSEVGYAVRR